MPRKSTRLPEVCPKCEGAGYVLTELGAKPCECMREAELQSAFRLARIPRKFLAKTLESFNCKDRDDRAKEAKRREIVTFAKNFLKTFRGGSHDHPGKGLLLMGREGTGKTHVAVSILKETIRKGYTGLYWNVPELFLELRRLMNDKVDISEADLFDNARRVDLLVLDDLGAERSSEYVTDRLYVMINGRYENDMPTIVTTNRGREELRSQLGPRIVSRLCEMCVPIEFPEGDFRLLNLK